ncbi:MAG: hypothetical protein HC836_22815 [Richelia sp. RM2_1_2]|nr:hypothetical protein [Richelia sp. RM2_1_2]
MTKNELLESIKHVAGFYDMYFSHIGEITHIPLQMSTLATVMWVRQYQDDIHSQRIRQQITCLWDAGMLKFDQ